MMLNILNQVVKKEKVDKIFLCTEEKEYQSYFKKKLGNKLITFNLTTLLSFLINKYKLCIVQHHLD